MVTKTTTLNKAISAACSTIGLVSLKAKQREANGKSLCYASSLTTCVELIAVVLSCVSIDMAYDGTVRKVHYTMSFERVCQ